jgi:uncharacterized protein with ParB-like and HNH nuclease domain
MSTTFDSTKRTLHEFLKDVHSGKLKLPDFQRGWVWDDSHILGLLASVAQSFPIGAVMLLKSGNEDVSFRQRVPVSSKKQSRSNWSQLLAHSKLPLSQTEPQKYGCKNNPI